MNIPKELKKKTGFEFMYSCFYHLLQAERSPVEAYSMEEERNKKEEIEKFRIFIVLEHGDKTQGWDVAFVWEKTEDGEFFRGASSWDVLDETTSKKKLWDYMCFHMTE